MSGGNAEIEGPAVTRPSISTTLIARRLRLLVPGMFEDTDVDDLISATPVELQTHLQERAHWTPTTASAVTGG